MLIRNCTLMNGADIFMEKMDIRIEDKKVKEVAPILEPADGEEITDAEGAIVTPGFVEASCHLGISNQIHRFDMNDADDANALAPELRAYDALNFEDEGFEMARRGGVTTVVACPGNANVIGGTCAAVKTAGADVDSRIIDPEIAYRFVFTNAPRKKFGGKGQLPMTRMATAAMIRDLLMKAREYHRKAAAGEKQPYKMDLEMLSRVFDGMLVQMVAKKANDMEAAIRIGEEFGLNYVLVMAYDAPTVIKDLARDDFRFVIGPLYGYDFSAEGHGRELTLGAEMERLGVPVAISTGHPDLNLEIIQTQMILMHDRGMSKQEILKGVTAYPAEFMGLDRVGTLEPGKDADLIVWDGDPFEYDGSVRMMLIDGAYVEV